MPLMIRVKHDDSVDQFICTATHRLKVLQLEPSNAVIRLLSLTGEDVWVETAPRVLPPAQGQAEA
jgi:hypothetical protein